MVTWEHQTERGSILYHARRNETVILCDRAVCCPVCRIMTYLVVNRMGESTCLSCQKGRS